MECVRGRVIGDARLPGLTPADRAATYDAMDDVLARLHNVDWKAVGLADFGKPGGA